MNLRPLLTKFLAALGKPSEFAITESLFLRLLGLVYIASFASFWPQIVGLIGTHGIAPADQLLQALRSEGSGTYFRVPTLFWLGISDRILMLCCAAGCLGGLLLVAGYFTRAATLACWMLYLSVVTVGEPFSAFQWDALLLESGFLALFAGASLLVWAYRLLLFRLMFESGIVKLTSHDPNWRNFHALRFHFLTQPLPNPIAYYAYRLPGWLLDSFTAATLFIELFIPFFLFGPRRTRLVAAGLLVFLQALILLTGNYAFFNLLTLALCLWALDDDIFGFLPRWFRKAITLRPFWLTGLANVALIVLLGLGIFQVIGVVKPLFAAPVERASGILGPFEIVNSYGLFAIMTTTRPEIILEGSDDQREWKEYSFRYKPGPLSRSLPFIAPYQPRLDWQMWFAALGTYDQNTWVSNLIYRLMTGEQTVIGLMQTPVPFARPPKYMRALLYDYQFTSPDERARTGAVWRRALQGVWWGPVSLRTP